MVYLGNLVRGLEIGTCLESVIDLGSLGYLRYLGTWGMEDRNLS